MTQLRCSERLFGVLEGGVIEVKCRSLNCKGGNKRAVVYHRFSAATGELIETRRYSEPVVRKESANGRT